MCPVVSAQTDPDSNAVSIDELDHAIVSCAGRINAATYEMLLLVRQFDERAGFLQWGLNNCADWLAWRCDLSLVTAKEKVRVAHALKLLPVISGSFSQGDLSYTKVRELTRVAHRDNEQFLLDFALRTTASNVAQRCRELRMGDDASVDSAARAFANRSLRLRRDPQRGMMVVSMELPLETGELLEKALDKARDDEVLESPDPADTAWSARQADAFLNMVTGYLGGTENDNGNDTENNAGNPDRSNDHYLVTIHVDQSALHGKEGRSSLPIETDFQDNWIFMRLDGIAVPEMGYHSRDMLDTDTGELSNVYNHPPAGALLSEVENFVKEPPAPAYLH